jgi:ABC-type uncharacterized transport system auxiliary subunit
VRGDWPDRARTAVAAILAVATVCGCAVPEPPVDRFYRLTLAEAPPPSQTVVLPGGVLVDRPVADGEVGNRAIIHVSADAPTELQTFSYHLWAAPPSNMLQDLLVRCVREGRVTDQVVKPEQRIDARYTLFSEVERLELQTGSPRRVLLALDIGLRDNQREQLLFSQPFQAEGVPADDSVSAAADALSVAFSTVCRALIGRLADR